MVHLGIDKGGYWKGGSRAHFRMTEALFFPFLFSPYFFITWTHFSFPLNYCKDSHPSNWPPTPVMPASGHHTRSCQNDPSGARGLHLQGWQAHVVGLEGWRKVTGPPFLLKTQPCETLPKQSRCPDELIYVTKAFFIFQSYHRILLKVKGLSVKTSIRGIKDD